MSEIAFRVVKEWDVVKVRITEEAKKRVDLLLSQKRCLGCGEKLTEGEQVKRGMHATCYQAARRAIRANRISESTLIREGKMLQPGVGGRKPSNDFTRELSGRS